MHGRRPAAAEARPNAAARGYDYAWAKLAKAHKAAHPECAWCGTKGRVVDHIVPLTQGGARLDKANLQTLCQPCHTIKTRREQGHQPSPHGRST